MHADEKTAVERSEMLGAMLKRSVVTLLLGSLASGLGVGCGDGQEPDPTLEAERAITSIMESDHVPGMAVALVKDRRIVWASGFGMADVATSVPVTADTAFWLASVSKTATGTAIMHAVENGLLSLEDDVDQLLATKADFAISAAGRGPIRLLHLVTHTSGIRDTDFYACAYFVGEELGARHSLANMILGEELCDESSAADLGGFLRSYFAPDGAYFNADNQSGEEPGSAFEYSNVGAAVAGYALELASGKSLADYAHEHLFAPLGLVNTSWRLADFSTSEIAIPYRWDEEAETLSALPVYNLSTWPDGGLRSTANDLARYMLMIMNGGEIDGRRILGSETVARMLTPLVTVDGLNVGVFWTTHGALGRTLVGHDGSDPGAFTFMYFDPVKKVGVVLLANGDADVNPTGRELRYAALLEKLLKVAETL